ncbi:hypothetical protein ACET3X_006471 [Alternaria dauci]|uniref:Actin-like ATPase domain-containing protein n=1 Tax=Alternaria dauci TaxID=48095 RepID=A0ABR3UDT2_9PLEO
MASEIVVGIDFGTTYSGVSWAINGINKVHLITDWPNPSGENAESEKVPTIISYADGKPHEWGYNVNVVGTEEKFQWFKLLLDSEQKLQGDLVTKSNNLLNSLNKSAEDIAADYLRLLWQYTKDHIQRIEGDTWENIYTLRVVLTVPAIWSPIAKERTLRAAKTAGLPTNIDLVAEPEAAALAVLQEKDKENKLEVGSSFVVCDCGGGTVDLISYKIIGLGPLKLEECVMGDGGQCGSVFLDHAFVRWVQTIVGEREYEKIKPKAKRRMLQQFEAGVKRCYNGDNKVYSVELPGVEDNKSEGIDDDTISLKPNTLQTLFDHVINKIMVLVERQIDTAQDKGQNVQAVLLVGGFGTNKYIYKRLKNSHRGDGIEVLQVPGGWSAICRGATLWGLEHSSHSDFTTPTVSARIARFSYGNRWDVPFDASRGHREIDRKKRPDGWYAEDQMNWLIKKGDRLEEGRKIHLSVGIDVQVGFFDTGIQEFSQQLWYCAVDEPPQRFMESRVKELCAVEYGVDRTKLYLEYSWKDKETRKKYRTATFDLTVTLNSATLQFMVAYKEKQVAYTEAKYKED